MYVMKSGRGTVTGELILIEWDPYHYLQRQIL